MNLQCFTVMDSRHRNICTHSYREAGETRQVSAKRQVLPLKHTHIWSTTAEGLFQCKRCKFKSGCFSDTLVNFVTEDTSNRPCGYLSRGTSFSADVFCTVDIILCRRIFTAGTKYKFSPLSSMAIYWSHDHVILCHVHDASHGRKPQTFSLYFCKLQAIKNWRQGRG